MGDDERGISIEELADRAGVPVRTVRFYVAEGLLPGPGARGKGAAYSDDHVQRLLLIRRLVEGRTPLAEIRERLAALTVDEVRALLAHEVQEAAQIHEAAATSPADYLGALLRRARSARERPQEEMPRRSLLGKSPPLPPPPPAASAPAPDLSPMPAAERSPEQLEVVPQDVWQRWQLAPGIELHIRADMLRRYRGLVERLRAEVTMILGRIDKTS